MGALERFLGFFAGILIKLGVKRELEGELIRFLFVGGTTAALQYTMALIFRLVLVQWLAVMIAYAISMAYNFSMHRHFTFHATHRRAAMQLSEYLCLSAINYGVIVLALHMLNTVLGLQFAVAYAAAALLTIAWSFPAQKFITFGKGIAAVVKAKRARNLQEQDRKKD